MTDVPRKPTLTGRAPRDTAEEVTQLRGEVETALTAVEHRLAAGAGTLADLRDKIKAVSDTASAANTTAIAAATPKRMSSRTLFAIITLGLALLGYFATLIKKLNSVDSVQEAQEEAGSRIESLSEQVDTIKVDQAKIFEKLKDVDTRQIERDSRIERKLDNLVRKKK